MPISDNRTVDPHDLNRFLLAQEGDFDIALSEITSGKKRSHWMWFIFPQFDGLGFSPTSKHFAIKNLEEAKAYLEHPILGPRLLACADAVMGIEGRTAHEIFGSPDDSKLKSCATLFACVSEQGSAFDRLLTKYYQGKRCEKTLKLVGVESAAD
jgi:uncharacterized protein (DUF1810 family)